MSHDSKFKDMYNDLGESVLVKSIIQHINGIYDSAVQILNIV